MYFYGMEAPEKSILNTELYNAIPTHVVVYTPIWDDKQKEIIDFRISYCNDTASIFLKARAEELIGTAVSELRYFDSTEKNDIIRNCREVWLAKNPITNCYFNESLDSYLEVVRSRVNDTIVCFFRDLTEKFRFDIQLKATSDELDAIFNSSLSALYLAELVYNQDGEICDLKFIRINKAYTRITGFSSSDVLGKRFSEVSSRTLSTDFLSNINRVLTTGSEEIFEVHYLGTNTWFDFSVVRLSSDRIVVTFNDITEKKLAQLSQQNQLALNQALLDSSLNVICAHKAVRNERGDIVDLQFMKINKISETILGLTDAVIGKSWLEIYPHAVETGVFADCVETIETGKTIRKILFYNYDGLDGWFEYSLVKLPDDGLMVAVSDVTGQRNDKLKLENNARFLQEIIDGTSTGMVLLEKIEVDGDIIDFKIKAINNNVAESMGSSPAHIAGSLFTKVFPDCRTNGFFEKYKGVATNGSPINFEYNTSGENHSVWLDIHAKRVGQDVLVSFNDITNLKSLTIQLQHSLEELSSSQKNEMQLRKLNEYKDEFLNIASHELKTPVTTIKACLQILGKSADIPENTQEFFIRAHKNINTLERLINDLLDVSKASVGQLTLMKKRVNMSLLVEELVSTFSANYPSRKITCQSNSKCFVDGDAVRLEQVVNNIIGNALKYSSGDVIVRVFEEEMVCISIQDFGKGIPEDEIESLFNRFFRSRDTNHIQGLGLGLYLSNEIIKAHSGSIEIESELGQGSVFKILLQKHKA